MKIRTDYVTNSSSSSFIISKRNLDKDQIEAIKNHWSLANKLGLIDKECDYPWNIEENDEYITGYVFMDNFCISELFDIIGINNDIVCWAESEFDLNDKNDIKYAGKCFNEKNDDWREYLNEL